MTTLQLSKGIWIGDDDSCEAWRLNDQGPILHANQTCTVPEFWFAQEDGDLLLNMVDANDPKYFSAYVFHVALDWIDMSVAKGKPILVHCNMGGSRSPSIALLWMAKRSHELPDDSFVSAATAFIHAYDPDYNPGSGIESFLRMNWEHIT